ncbi:noggin-2-like [Frankliniella occidentalis]|uniref:Noggin-2-like n=1 Tax=Frankliniella occidentalis TaxID=133901 RepID=A0A6J1T410_FRAOC|nr:noggin-2-like [Frankliniella occidentalis]
MEMRLLVLLALAPLLTRCARLEHVPDGTGLVGGPPDRPLQQLLPLKMWANPRRSQLRPRRKDLREDTLLNILGEDYQPGWMRWSRAAGSQEYPVEERAAVRALRDLVDGEESPPDLRLPAGLTSEARALVKAWLVRRATCPVRFVWADLGPYFWPRWLRRGECGVEPSGDEQDEDNMTTSRRGGVSGVLREDEDDEDEDAVDGAPRRANATSTLSCSWPPGMKCVPGLTRTLHILRWHCRLRKLSQATSFNAIWSAPPEKPPSKMDGRQKRSKYRCTWIKVPYSVPEDCVCSV